MNLDQEIDRALGAIWGGEHDPRQILKDLVQKARGAGAVDRLVPKCGRCGTPDAVCAMCQARDFAGEQLVNKAMPWLMQKFQQGMAERARKKDGEG